MSELVHVADEVTDFLDEVNPSRFDEALEEMVEASRDVLAKATDDVAEEIQQQVDEIVGGVQRQADELGGSRSITLEGLNETSRIDALADTPVPTRAYSNTNRNPNILRGEIHPVEPITIRYETPQAASDYLQQNYKIKTDFSGAHIRNINLIVNEIDDLIRNDSIFSKIFPILQDELDEIRIRMVGEVPDELDIFYREGAGVGFNEAGTIMEFDFNLGKFGVEAPISAMSVEDPMYFMLGRNIPEAFPVYNIQAAIRHEFGHIVDAFIRTRIPQEIREFEPFTRGSIGELINDNWDLLETLSPSTVSYYDYEHIGEFFAESYSAIRYLPSQLPDSFSKLEIQQYLNTLESRVLELVEQLVDEFTIYDKIEPYSLHKPQD